MIHDSYVLTASSVATMSLDSTEPYGLLPEAAIAVEGGMIVWVGSQTDLPERFAGHSKHHFGDSLITPALIDCHTHVVYGGNRAAEFEMRLNGASYEEIARSGGGIVSTVRSTRAASESDLLKNALQRIDAMIAEGVCLVEIKSGYGLDQDAELKMLRVARRIAALRPIRVQTSFLGAHAIPPDHSGQPDAYIDEVCIPTLHRAHAEGLVDAVDGFCEGIAFSPDQISRVFDAAEALGLPIKLHAEQLSNLGGAKLAASRNALSADHLEYLDEDAALEMAQSGTVAVLLPGAFYTLRETRKPPVALLRRHGVRIAVATDCNPGSSPISSPLLSMNMACTLFQLTPEEALAGVTRNAAAALGLSDAGMIATGQRADLAVWSVAHPAELSYRIGFNSLKQRIFGGHLD